MGDDDLVNQNDIEKLLAESGAKPTPAGPAPVKAEASEAASDSDSGGDEPQSAAAAMEQSEIEAMLSGGKPAPVAHSEDDNKLLAQDDIEKLLSQAGRASPAAPKPAAPRPADVAAASASASAETTSEGRVAEKDVEFLLRQAEEALRSIDSPPDHEFPHGVASFRFQQFGGAPASTESATLDLIRDVDLDVQIELGRTHMYLEEVLKLRKGSVVPLDKLAGDPVDIFVNGRLIARGEVLVLNDNFCVRVAELIAGTEGS